MQDTWQEMEKLVDDGLVKSIGISNFSCKKVDDLLSYARIQPAAIQVEVHPYFRNQKLMDHAKAKVTFSSSLLLFLSCIWLVLDLLCVPTLQEPEAHGPCQGKGKCFANL